MTEALKEELKHWFKRLEMDEADMDGRYRNSGMLLRLPNGLAVEPVLIRKKFEKWQDAHPEFPHIVFHGLRHSSATYQLIISGGDDFYKSYEACPTRPLSAQEATFSVKKQTSQLRRAGLFAIKNNFPLKMPRVKRRAFKWLGLR